MSNEHGGKRKGRKSKKKRWLRSIAVILSVCLLVTTCPNILEIVPVFAADGALKDQDHGTHGSGWTQLSNSNTSLTKDGNYYLNADKTNYITVASGVTANLCLNGHSINVSYAFSEATVIKVESGATLNLYDCQEGGMVSATTAYSMTNRYKCIYASGAGAKVNLYGGTVGGQNCFGVYLEDGAQLLLDGGNVECKFTASPNGIKTPVYIPQGSSGEIRSGDVSLEITEAVSYNYPICFVDGSLVISGGTLGMIDQAGNRHGYLDLGYYSSGDAYLEINGGTIDANVYAGPGNLVINHPDFSGYANLRGGILQLQGGQSLGTESGGDVDISIGYKSMGGGEYKDSLIELTGPLTKPDGYRIQLSLLSPSSRYPITITKNFSTYMSGKDPNDCFTYISSGEIKDHYKILLQDGEVVLLPYVMTFDANGGTLEDSEDSKHVITNGKGDITGGQYMRALPEPTREGYDFDGWYTQKVGGTSVTIDNEPLDQDITVYAHWTPIDYSITYELDGGTLSGGKTNPNTYTIESAAFTLNNPSRTGYTFTGWSGTGLTGNTNKTVTVAKGSIGERTFTANWKAADYTVTLNGNGGAGTALTGYTYGTGATLPVNWTKTGYTFAGWYGNENLTGSKVTAISGTDMGNKAFYAKWTANPYVVIFDYQGATGGNSEKTRTVTYDSTYGTVSDAEKSLPSPTRTGYTFKGWYTQAGGKGNKITDTATVNITAAQTLYAYWLDETPPDAPVLTSGTTLPREWTNTQKTIPLTLQDGVGVTEVWVSVDNGSYEKVSGFTGGSTSYAYPVQEGNHSYRFQAKDAAGNTSEESAVFTFRLDTTKPVIGSLVFVNRVENFREWMKSWVIGKKNLVIQVPVTEAGSGVLEVDCVMTPFGADGLPDASQAETKTFSVTNGRANITFSKDFQGTFLLSCTDGAGNTSDSVTVGTKGVIAEDTAPVITSDAEAGYCETAPDLSVSVKDEGAAAAGIASVSYKIGDGEEKSTAVEESEMQTALSFTIPASEFSTGIQQIVVRAADNAGNLAEKTITVKIKGPEKKPEVRIRYTDEKLTNLIPEAQYVINGSRMQADGEGCISIREEWIGTTGSIVKSGNGVETFDSEAQELVIPARPETPAPIGVDESRANVKDGKLTGLNAGSIYQFSTDNGVIWKVAEADESGAIANLAPGSYQVRINATESSFRSHSSQPAEISAGPVKITFLAEGEELESVTLGYGESLAGIPDVPEKEGYTGAWDKEASEFANIREDMTVQAVYTIKTYQILLPENQTGYSLQLADGASETVSHGEARKVNYTLAKGYSETEGFAIKANGTTVLPENGSILLENITEDITLTVEGVADITPPEAEIVLGENKWNTLLNKITFGLFFNKTQTVTITAKDRDENLDEIYYYLADGSIENPAAVTDWQKYTGTFSVEPGKYVIYAKAQDSTGNLVMINSERVVVDTTAPIIKIGGSTAENNAAYTGEQTLTVEEEWLAGVTLDGNDITQELTSEGSYLLSPAEEAQTITAVDKAGNKTSRTVTVSDKPDVPDIPDNPNKPDAPDKPDSPENMTKPDKPETPDISETPENPKAPTPESGQPVIAEAEPDKPGSSPRKESEIPEKKNSEDTESAAAETEQEKVPDDGTVTARNTEETDRKTVPVTMEDDSLVLTGETVATGNIGNTANTKTVLELGSGAVIVTVVCEEKEYAAGVADTVAVANAVLTPEQKKQAKDGETVEVEITVKNISDRTPEGDKAVIEKGMKALQKDIKDLILGAYVDISMAVRVGGGSWETIASTKEPIEIVVEIPKELREKGRQYYIIRSHEGEYAFLEDLDKEQNTITVSTDRFSTYAIAYRQTEGTADKCSLCHHCPTFLGICYFVWLAIVLAAVLLVLAVFWKKRKEKEQ